MITEPPTLGAGVGGTAVGGAGVAVTTFSTTCAFSTTTVSLMT
jgi:hypothetical protein